MTRDGARPTARTSRPSRPAWSAGTPAARGASSAARLPGGRDVSVVISLLIVAALLGQAWTSSARSTWQPGLSRLAAAARPIRHRHALRGTLRDHRHRDAHRDAARSRRGDLPLRVRQPARRRALKPILEILAGIPSRRARLLRARRPRADHHPAALQQQLDLQHGRRRPRRRHPDHAAHRVRRRGCDARGADRRCARRSYGLGARKRSTSLRVVVPAAVSGIVAALILGVSRAIGETMVVAIAAGAVGGSLFTVNPCLPGQTMTAAMTALATGSDQARGDALAFPSLFFVGLLLFAHDARAQRRQRALRAPLSGRRTDGDRARPAIAQLTDGRRSDARSRAVACTAARSSFQAPALARAAGRPRRARQPADRRVRRARCPCSRAGRRLPGLPTLVQLRPWPESARASSARC